MISLFKRIEDKFIVVLVNILILLFFICFMAFNRGYNYISIALVAIGFLYFLGGLFRFRDKLVFSNEDKYLMCTFLGYFMIFVLAKMYHSDGLREIDNPTRVMLFLPLLLLFRHFPIKPKMMFYGVMIGSAIVGVLAVYHRFYLELPKPFPYLMHIQAGDIAISLAMLSFVIAIYWGIKKDYKVMLLGLICVALGIIASVLTGARGGWIGIPVILGMILVGYAKYLNKKVFIYIVSMFSLFIGLLILTPKFGLTERYESAKSDVVLYFEKGEKSTSNGGRLDMWHNAWLGIKQKPLLGWGSYGYKQLKQQQWENGTLAETTLAYNDAHNQYLDMWVKKGIIGLFSLIAFFLVPLSLFIKGFVASPLEIRVIKLLGIVHIVSVMFFCLTQTFLAHNSGVIWYVALVIFLHSIASKYKESITL